MVDETHSLKLRIDAASAKAGADEFSTAIKAVKAAVVSLERDTTGAFTALRKIRPEVDVTPLKSASVEAQRLSTSISGSSPASARAAADIRNLAIQSTNALRISADQASRLRDRLLSVGDTNGLARLEAGLSGLRSSLINATSGIDVREARAGYADLASQLNRTARESERLRAESISTLRAQEEASRAAATQAAQLEALALKYNPLRANSRAYAESLDEVNRAEQAGVLTSQLAEQARTRAAQSLLATSAASDRFTTSAHANGAAISNVSAQFQDIGVMMAAGQNPFQLALQQGTQLSAVLNQMGGKAGVLKTLAAGFGQMVNPISLVTIGVILAGSAIVNWMTSGGEATKTFEEAIGDANSAISTLSTATDTLAGARLGTLATGYGRVNEALRVHLERLKEVATYEAMTANRDTANAIQDSITGGWITSDVDDVRIALDTTNDSARFFLHLLDQVKSAQTFGEQAKAISTARAYLEGLGINLTTSEGAAKGVLAQLVKAEDSALKLEAASDGSAKAIGNATGQTNAWAAAMGGVAAEISAIMAGLNDISGGSLSMASKAAESAALRAGRTVSQAAQERARVENEAKLRRQTESAGTGIGGFIMSGVTAVERYQFDQNARLDTELEAQRKAAREAATSSTGKGGSGRVEALGDESRQLAQLSKQMNDRIFSIQRENSALTLLAEGTVSTKEAAELYSMALAQNNGQMDAGTLSTIRLYEAQVKLQAQLEKDAANPLQDYLDSLPTATQGLKQFSADAAQSLEGELKNMFMTGDFNFKNMADSLRNALADTLAKQTASMITQFLSGIAGGMGGGGGGLLSFVGSIFGFSEGGYSDRPGMTSHMVSPAAFRNAPQFKAGTTNTSGIPAILHPNEAVVPLSKGRKIPVDASGLETGGGIGTVTTTHNWGGVAVTINTEGSMSDPAEANRAAEQIADLVKLKVQEQLAVESSYGGILNPRGGR